MPAVSPPGPRSRALTPRIAVVSHRLGSDSYEREVISGIVHAVVARGGSVLFFAVKGVENEFDAFIGTQNVDAVVLLSGPLIQALGTDALEAFCAKRSHMPLASIGAPLSGSGATIRADGAAGVRKAVAHLVDVHGRRRIGFLRGPETSFAMNERLEGYKQGLAENGIALNPEWITPSSDLERVDEPIRVLFDERKQDLQAVVTFNDAAAIAALSALVQRGTRVPEDVAVIGCHDIPEADHVVPPITTVTQKLHEQGWRAANLVLNALDGEALSDQLVETELVLRRSCGCFPRSVLEVRGSPPFQPSGPGARGFEECKPEFALAMRLVLGPGEAHSSERLIAAFSSDLGSGAGARRFLFTLDERLNKMARLGTDFSRWEEAISVWRRLALPSLVHDEARRSLAEDLWHEARVLIGDTAQRAQAYQRMLDQETAHAFGGISQSLIATKDVQELGDVLARGLPRLGVKSCYVSLYDDVESRETSTLVLCIEEERRESTRLGARFATELMAPEGVLRQEPGSVMVVLPLSFKGEQRGMILLEAGPNHSMSYDELREQFGAAFKRMDGERELVRLHAAQRERVEELERAHHALRENQEKLLISERMASLGRLAAGMAHEMSTPLAAVRAALGEMLELVSEYRASIGVAEVTPQDHREIADDMEASTRLADSAAQRVAAFVRGIKAETRDLSSTEFGHFDPVPVIEEMLLLLSHAARAANCTVTLKPQQRVMNLFGSPTRLWQVVTNLVTNAIDASAEKGGGPIEVALKEWDGGIELRVTDRGTGIAPENLGKIFHPMYTSKPFGLGTGLGLAIVHDIVTGDFNGTIEVESLLGEGTSFVLRLTNPS